MVVTFSDDEVSDHESENGQEGNFMAFTTTAIVSESEIVKENPSDGELSENANLQEVYNKLCKIAAKDAMNVDLGLKKINTLEQEKKNLLVKLFDANELITSIKIENMSLIEKVKSLESKLSIARKQLDRTFTSKLDNMLNDQKSSFDKIALGFVESVSSSVVHPPKFVLATSISTLEVRIPKEETLATRKIRVDLSESKPKKLNHLESKKQHKPQWFCRFCGEVGHTCPNCFKLQASKQATKQKVSMPKAQDPMSLIHELVKALNLYANTRADFKSSSSRNSNLKFASKRVWMQSVDAKDSISVSLSDMVLVLIPSIFCDQKYFSLGFAFALH